MYQVCTCNAWIDDPHCPIHGKQPESEITVWPPDNMEWISITDRPPKDGQSVLVYFFHEGIDYVEIGSRTPEFGFEVFYMTIGREEYQHKITHWMPLPKPPTEGGP